MGATGLSKIELRACYANAAERIRNNEIRMAAKQPTLDWREVTVVDALKIIADHAAKPKKMG